MLDEPADGRRTPRRPTAVARTGAIALGVAWIVNATVTAGARAAGIGEGLDALAYPSVLSFTAAGVVGATLVYLALDRLTAAPDRAFVVVAAVVLVLSVVPDFTYIPAQPGGSVRAGAVLASMHVTTAAIATGLLVDWRGIGGASRRDR